MSPDLTSYTCELFSGKVVLEGTFTAPGQRWSEPLRMERPFDTDETRVAQLAAEALRGTILRRQGPTDGPTSFYSADKVLPSGAVEEIEFLGGDDPWITNDSPLARVLAELLDDACRR